MDCNDRYQYDYTRHDMSYLKSFGRKYNDRKNIAHRSSVSSSVVFLLTVSVAFVSARAVDHFNLLRDDSFYTSGYFKSNTRQLQRLPFTVDEASSIASVHVTSSYHLPGRHNPERPQHSLPSHPGRQLAARRARKDLPRSEYISLGKVRAFTGDLQPPASLALALENRSYRREVILITDNRPRAALQQFDNLARLGLVHVLWLAAAASNCAAMEELLAARDSLEQYRQRAEGQAAGAAAAGAGLAAAGRLLRQQDMAGRWRTLAQEQEAAGSAAATGEVRQPGLAHGANMSLIANIAAAAAAANRGRSVRGSALKLSPDDRLACSWYDAPLLAAFGGHRRLMLKRIMLLARIVTMGYNVLSLDTDVLVYRDPYVHLKAPPYASMHMVAGKGVRGGAIVNTGVMYLHNASRHGPVAWLVTEVVLRNLRWIEAGSGGGGGAGGASAQDQQAQQQLLAPHQAETRGCWDQQLFGDVVLTAMLGKMSLYYCAKPPERAAAGAGGLPTKGTWGRKVEDEWSVKHRTVMGLQEKQNPMDLMQHLTTFTSTDPALTDLVAADSYVTLVVNLTVPPATLPPLLPDEPGYVLPGIRPGGAAERFQRQIMEDASHVRLEARRALRRTRRWRALLAAIAVDDEQGAEMRGTSLSIHVGGGLDNSSSSSSSSSSSDRERRGNAAVASAGRGPRGDRGAGGREGSSRRAQRRGLSQVGGGVGDLADPLAPVPLPPLRREEEQLAYAAEWLVGGWQHRGILGFWDPFLTGARPKQVFGHLVRAPGPTGLGKDAVRMQYGEYDWELAALTEGGPFPFLGSPSATQAPRVVALLPDLDINTYSANQWLNTARGLVHVALMTGRRVVWPAVPCASKWVQPNPGSRRALPLNPNSKFLAHGTFGDGLLCTPAAVFHPKCLYERLVSAATAAGGTAAGAGPGEGTSAAAMLRAAAAGGGGGGDPEADLESVGLAMRREGPRGLLGPEFELLRRLLPRSLADPGPHNTVSLQANDDYEDNGADRPVMFNEPPRTEDIVYVKAAVIAGPLRSEPLASQPVLYLAQRTFVTQLDKLGDEALLAEYRVFKNECPALR